MNLYLFVVLSLIEKISGKRGRGTIVKLLRGGKGKSVLSLKNGDTALDERYSGIMAKVPNNKILAIFDELLKGGNIEIVEDIFMGHWYPLVYITGKGKEALVKNAQSVFGPKLEYILKANRTLIEFQKELTPVENQPSQNGGEKNDKE